uniref:Uncharacterized protein n=1 Tax=Ditylenchus dipsaci TaxID=166011 RepID=A0A915DR59_9BILA
MSAKQDKLTKAIVVLEQSISSLNESKPSTFGRKKSSSLEKDRQACQDIRDGLTSWELSHLHRIDFSRAIGLLFQCLDHRESAIRILADQSLDAIFRRFQIKFQPQRVIATLLTELSKKSSARCLCGAFKKLALTIHSYRSHRAGIYGLHFMNSVCIALVRPEESVQLAIEKTFPVIFAKVGSFVGVSYVEKAEELFQTALLSLDLSGAANRSACVVIANLAKFVPSILHKSFYKLSSIIFEPDDIEHKARLTGALNAFRFMWESLVNSLTEFSLNTLQKLLCKVVCCLYSASTEVVVAALELLECAVTNTQTIIMDFSPFLAEGNQCSSVFNSPFHISKTEGGELLQNTAKLDDKFLGMEELESVISKSPWTSMNDVSEAFGSDVLSGRDGSLLDFPQSSNASQATNEPVDDLDRDSFSTGQKSWLTHC